MAKQGKEFVLKYCILYLNFFIVNFILLLITFTSYKYKCAYFKCGCQKISLLISWYHYYVIITNNCRVNHMLTSTKFIDSAKNSHINIHTVEKKQLRYCGSSVLMSMAWTLNGPLGVYVCVHAHQPIKACLSDWHHSYSTTRFSKTPSLIPSELNLSVNFLVLKTVDYECIIKRLG